MKSWRMAVFSVLGLTLAAKVISLANPVPLLKNTDPVVGVPLVMIMVAAAVMEFIICASIVFFENDQIIAYEVLAFSLIVLTYRLLANLSGMTYCPCLGNIADWWPWLGQHQGPLLMTVVNWLLGTSFFKIYLRREQA